MLAFVFALGSRFACGLLLGLCCVCVVLVLCMRVACGARVSCLCCASGVFVLCTCRACVVSALCFCCVEVVLAL